MWIVNKIGQPLCEVELPAGYYAVRRGPLKPGDLHLNARLFPGVVEWLPAKLAIPDETVNFFLLVIRPGNVAVAQPCIFFTARKGFGPYDCHGRTEPGEWICQNCRAFYLANPELVDYGSCG